MGSESIAQEGESDNCFSKIQLVGQKYRDKTAVASKTRFSRHCFGFQSQRFSAWICIPVNIRSLSKHKFKGGNSSTTFRYSIV